MNSASVRQPSVPLDQNSASAAADCSHIAEGDHFVQFYDEDATLVATVSRYCREGLSAGDTAVLIATPAHLEAIARELAGAEVDVGALQAARRYIQIDAARALASFMVDGTPDAALFDRHIGQIVVDALQRGRRVRAFGEMVALLWAQGATTAALQLEGLWNDLRRRHPFTLCCGYQMKGFARDAESRLFLDVCRAHSRVMPVENYADCDPDTRTRALALLQQKSVALEAEVAERRRVEEALRREKQELTAFVENASIGLHWVGPDGLILWANAAEMEMLGYERTEYIGHHVEEFHAEKTVIDDILSRLCRGERLRNHPARLRCKDGTIKTVLIDSSVLWDNGRFVHTQCFTRDITEQKRNDEQLAAARDALARANEELERRVAERTSALQEAATQLEDFAYTVSHDLRAPLRGIQVYSETLLDDYGPTLDPRARRSVERIAQNVARLDRLIVDVLDFTRVSRADLPLAPISLERLVGGIIRDTPALQPPHADLEVGALPDAIGHEPSLGHVFSNLLLNAVKFVPPGRRPAVRVRSEQCDGAVVVSIEDNGIGIPPAQQGRIFRLFERLRPNYEGTGMGLAIVRKAITRMGGDVGVESDGVNGSRFWVRLKAAAPRA